MLTEWVMAVEKRQTLRGWDLVVDGWTAIADESFAVVDQTADGLARGAADGEVGELVASILVRARARAAFDGIEELFEHCWARWLEIKADVAADQRDPGPWLETFARVAVNDPNGPFFVGGIMPSGRPGSL